MCILLISEIFQGQWFSHHSSFFDPEMFIFLFTVSKIKMWFIKCEYT